MVMKIEYEDGTLRIENALGLRWQLNDVGKPEFTFSYDALSVTEQHAVRRVSGCVYPLAEAEAGEVRDFVRNQSPPPGVTLQRQVVADLRAFAHGLINSVVTQLEYEGLLDVMITARDGSTDLYAEEARRVLTYVDAIWNAYYGLAAQISNTPEGELTSAQEYARMMPFPPAIEHFSNVVPEELFDAAQRKR
jgi:hypothetical protein